MGSGIAKEIKETYPEAYAMDWSTTYGDKNKLGTFTWVKVQNKYFPEKEVCVVNAYTQYTYGRKEGEIYANYDAIKNVMIKINEFFSDTPITQLKIGFPRIGAGLARGDWNIISKLIEDAFGNKTVYVYQWDNGEVKKEEFDLERMKKLWKQQLNGEK